MHGLALFGSSLVVALSLVGCISKGDTEVETGSPEEEAQTLCGQHCDKQEEQCGPVADCEDDCVKNGESCPGETQTFLECALGKPVGCDATNTPYTTGCDEEFSALLACLSDDGGECTSRVGIYENCENNAACCEAGSICIGSADTSVGPTCFPTCEDNTECFSGCCLAVGGGGRACGLPADCAPVAVGDPCLNPTDCESGLCIFGGCVAECETSADCGENFLGEANGCWQEGEPPVCLPGCVDDTDCVNYYGDDLTCLEHADGKYCF